MFLSIIVSLYTSRVVLQTLGEVDFGVYGLVGSIVTMFAFLNTCMSGATSRFFTYEMGKGDNIKLQETFSTALYMHIGIAILIFISAEIVGIWLLPELDMPDNRRYAAHIVYQLSIISMMITVTQVPYNATIIAHEKMDVYAYVELLHVVLKLAIVYILMIGNFDKLILYAILVLVVNIIVAFIYRIYSIKNYEESHFKLSFSRQTMMSMLTFSLWDLYGNMSVSFRQQGVNILINKFFGAVLNAASGIATMVQGIISGFSKNILQAFRPQIIKNYSNGSYKEMQKLMQNAIIFALLMLFIISVPLIYELDFIMSLWLGEVPVYATTFCKILLLMNFIGVINNVLTIAIHATGKVKVLSFTAGSTALFTIPIIFLYFKYTSYPPETAYYVLLSAAIIMIIIELFIINRLIPDIHISSIVFAIVKTITIGLVATMPILMLHNIESNVIRLLTTIILYFVITTIIAYFILLDKKTQKNLMTTLKNKIGRQHNQ